MQWPRPVNDDILVKDIVEGINIVNKGAITGKKDRRNRRNDNMTDHRLLFSSGDTNKVAICCYPKNKQSELEVMRHANMISYGECCNPKVMFSEIFLYLQICFDRINNTFGNTLDYDSIAVRPPKWR